MLATDAASVDVVDIGFEFSALSRGSIEGLQQLQGFRSLFIVTAAEPDIIKLEILDLSVLLLSHNYLLTSALVRHPNCLGLAIKDYFELPTPEKLGGDKCLKGPWSVAFRFLQFQKTGGVYRKGLRGIIERSEPAK
ncbi:hypothetical protein [Sphingomicrobium sediminis]|uniref:Uncharacterized protein n=1 Tax=Sphingomicrobium sediminis TaxID=2950949 RepID=A0A9X2EFI6_9SPHN|nr:hypothetical protein [Sphingomicrobium sediminis]MCM8556610.1 hypothetical protein [Sphingomicrobium sediminis]